MSRGPPLPRRDCVAQMIHRRVKIDGTGLPKPMWAVYLLLGILTLAIGSGLLLLQHYFSGVEIGPEHGADDPSNLHLLAFPLFLIAGAFLLAAVNRGLASGSDARSVDGVQLANSLGPLGDGPRRLTPSVTFAILFRLPTSIQLGWAFFVGFAFCFYVLGGPTAVGDLWPSHEKRVKGEVVKVAGLEQWEFMRQVYEYTFRYELAGTTSTGKSHAAGRRYNVGDPVEILIDPSRPDASRIADTRRQSVSWWVLAIPLGVLLLLPVGIIGNCIFNFRVLYFVRNGLIATATRYTQRETPTSATGAPAQASPSKYIFQVDGQTYTVDRRSWVSGRSETVPVLYSPENPLCNVGLDGRRSAMLLGAASPWPLCLIGVLVPTACIAALMWLWTTR